MTFGERLKELRKYKNMTQQEFSDKLKIKRPTIANYEADRVEPSSAVIACICREYGVNEIWLRSGGGGMLQAMREDEELAAYLGDVRNDGTASFRRRLTMEMENWTQEVWQMLEEICKRLATEKPDTE